MKVNVIPEKRFDWYTSKDRSKERFKTKIKRRPGMPKKKIKTSKYLKYIFKIVRLILSRK